MSGDCLQSGCYGRVGNGNYFYYFAPIFITMTDTVSLFFGLELISLRPRYALSCCTNECPTHGCA
jgi:hypothetical protein